MHSYCLLLVELEEAIRELHNTADRQRILIIERKGKADSDEDRWISNFAQADNAFEQLCYRWFRTDGNEKTFSILGESTQLVRKIQEKMDQVNTPEYKEQLLGEIEKFSSWMVIFSGKKVLPELQAQKSTKETVQEAFLPEFLQVNKNSLQARIGNDNFTFVYDKQDQRSDNVMLLVGADSREKFVNMLIANCDKEPFNQIIAEEITQLVKDKKLPPEVFSKQCDKYNKLIKAKKLVEADAELRKLCKKSKSFVSTYLQQRYLMDKAGIPYIPKKRGLLNTLSILYERECYVMFLSEERHLELLERIECRHAKNPPVYLLYYPVTPQDETDYPHFDRLIELKQQTKALARQSNGPAFFGGALPKQEDKNALLQQAEQAYLASQIKGIRADDLSMSLDVAITRMDSLLRLEPKNPRFHLLRAKYLASKGDPTNRSRSIADFELALNCCPAEDNAQRCEILTERGITFAFLNETEKAIADYTQVLKIDSNMHRVRLFRGGLFRDVKRNYQEAMAEFSYVIDHLIEGEVYQDVLKLRLNTAILIENYGLVVQDAKEYLRLNPNDTLVEAKREQALLKLEESHAVMKKNK